MINDIKVAFAFLTRIPIGHKPDISIQRSAVWFPFVGWVIGGVTAVLYYFLSQGIPALPAATITILFSTLVTGGFHQDGHRGRGVRRPAGRHRNDRPLAAPAGGVRVPSRCGPCAHRQLDRGTGPGLPAVPRALHHPS